VEVSDDGDEFVVAPGGAGRPTDLVADSERPFTLLFHSPVPARFVRITVRRWKVEPMKPMLNAHETYRLTLKCDQLLSSFAFSFKLRHYITVLEWTGYVSVRASVVVGALVADPPTASRKLSSNLHTGGDGSLEGETSWCAAAADRNAAMSIDLGSEMEVMVRRCKFNR